MWYETEKSRERGATIYQNPNIVNGIPHNRKNEKFPIIVQTYNTGGDIPLDGTVVICQLEGGPLKCGNTVQGGRLTVSCGIDMQTRSGYIFKTLEANAKRPLCYKCEFLQNGFQNVVGFEWRDESVTAATPLQSSDSPVAPAGK